MSATPFSRRVEKVTPDQWQGKTCCHCSRPVEYPESVFLSSRDGRLIHKRCFLFASKEFLVKDEDFDIHPVSYS